MAISNEREYRNFNSFHTIIKRNEEQEEKKEMVEGYASTFEEYSLMDFGDEEWRERIEPDAFNDADMSDVVFLRDHTGRVFARTKNNTISIIPDERGLFTITDLSRTAAAREMYEDIAEGNYSQMSFAFTVAEQHFDEHKEGEKRIITRIIDRIKKVYDISAVAFPANPTTDIGVSLRSVFDGGIEELRAERLKAQEAEARAERARKLEELKTKFKEVSES